MEMSAKKLNVIYDGDCGFCRRSLRVVAAFDSRNALRFHDARLSDTLEKFPELRGVDLEDAMYVVVAGEPVYRGFFAFRRLIWSNPSTWIFIPLFYFPGARFFGPRVYAWVARNRNRFGCRTDVCDLSSSPRT
jgi:predicted DCC family thiol-disulfide oxidoreductase YuxK